MSVKQDVRILKTKERLRNALLSLLKDKPLDEITISEICNKASVNRNTFYSHYESVKDLQGEIEGLFMETLVSKIHVSSATLKSETFFFLQVEYPQTIAPAFNKIRVNHVPLNPVCPVTNTFLPL